MPDYEVITRAEAIRRYENFMDSPFTNADEYTNFNLEEILGIGLGMPVRVRG